MPSAYTDSGSYQQADIQKDDRRHQDVLHSPSTRVGLDSTWSLGIGFRLLLEMIASSVVVLFRSALCV